MDLVKYVKENRGRLKNYRWLKQFDENADGHRFTPQKFQGMKLKYGKDEVADGIVGDRWMKQNAKTKILEGITMDDFRKGFSNAQCNDLINYSAWNAFDILSLRVSEGQSEIIPRAQYEFTAFFRDFSRGPEWTKLLIHRVGWQKYMKRFYDARGEIGAKMSHHGHTWSAMNCHMFGAMALESLGYVDPDDPIVADKKYWSIFPWAVRAYALRGGDGSVYESQKRYVWDMDQSVVNFLMENMEPLDDKKLKLFKKVDAVATMLGFDMHYDCRAGRSDKGPHIVEDGKIMLLSTCYINEPEYYWCEPCARRNLPFSVSLAFVINPEKIGLQELRVNGISTTFSQPSNLWPGIEQACVFLRYEPDEMEPLPFSKLKKLDWSEIPDFVNLMEEAIYDWYAMISNMSLRARVINGHMVYSWDPHVGHAFRGLGCWEEYKEILDYWEWPPIASDSYYQAKGKVANEIMPVRLFTGGGWTDIPDQLASKSRYRDEILKRAYDLGWESDLSGNKPIPNELKSMFDEDRIFRPNIPFDVSDDWMK